MDTLMYADQPAKFEAKPKVVCFGDSITNRGYYKLLGEQLGVEAINAGVGGNSTAKGLRRMQADVLDQEPDVVVIFFGTNDLRVDAEKVHVPVEKYGANLSAMITKCRAQGAKVVLCTLPPIEHEAFFTRHEKQVFDSAGGLGSLIAAYDGAAEDVAKAEGVALVDLNQILASEPTWLSKDGVHPTEAGTAIIAKHIAGAVEPLLR